MDSLAGIALFIWISTLVAFLWLSFWNGDWHD